MKLTLRRYKVANITDDLTRYPECKEDTETFPHLVSHLEDEYGVFIVNTEDHSDFYPGNEFFMMLNIKDFVARVEAE